MAAFNKFNSFVEALAKKQHNLATDTLKVMLTNTAPTSANTQSTDITEIAAGNGYAAGGPTVTVSGAAQTGGVFKLSIADQVITASGGALPPARYAVLYNSTSGKLIGWWDYGSSFTLQNGDAMTVDFDDVNGVLQIA